MYKFLYNIHLYASDEAEKHELVSEIKNRFEEVYKYVSLIEDKVKEDDVLIYTCMPWAMVGYMLGYSCCLHPFFQHHFYSCRCDCQVVEDIVYAFFSFRHPLLCFFRQGDGYLPNASRSNLIWSRRNLWKAVRYNNRCIKLKNSWWILWWIQSRVFLLIMLIINTVYV